MSNQTKTEAQAIQDGIVKMQAEIRAIAYGQPFYASTYIVCAILQLQERHSLTNEHTIMCMVLELFKRSMSLDEHRLQEFIMQPMPPFLVQRCSSCGANPAAAPEPPVEAPSEPAKKTNQYGLTSEEWSKCVEIGGKLHEELDQVKEDEDWYDSQSDTIMKGIVEAFKAGALTRKPL